MDSEEVTDHTTWRWLWVHTARQIIFSLALPPTYEPIQIHYGWGVCNRADQTTLLLHPSGGSHESGDLSLTISGQPTAVIPRDGRAYTEYVEYVTEVVARALQECFANEAAGEPREGSHTLTH